MRQSIIHSLQSFNQDRILNPSAVYYSKNVLKRQRLAYLGHFEKQDQVCLMKLRIYFVLSYPKGGGGNTK